MSSRSRKNKSIPDGWKDYSPVKDTIDDIQIVPFKVPLPERIFQRSDMMGQHKWTPEDVRGSIPDLGLVIDLTFKFPSYYNTDEFTENGVRCVKIGCKGHDIPSEETFEKFCDTVDKFVASYPDRIVGVHCTHGVNRTGYMICRYMIERRGYEPENAIEIFATKRGHTIDRDNYIQRLRECKKK